MSSPHEALLPQKLSKTSHSFRWSFKMRLKISVPVVNLIPYIPVSTWSSNMRLTFVSVDAMTSLVHIISWFPNSPTSHTLYTKGNNFTKVNQISENHYVHDIRSPYLLLGPTYQIYWLMALLRTLRRICRLEREQ